MSISKVGQYVFADHSSLIRAVVSAQIIESNAFARGSKLNVVELTSPDKVDIKAGAFSQSSILTHLVIRSSETSILRDSSAFTGTSIGIGDGGIYVPSELLSSYKSATNWSAIASSIYPISEYPKTIFESINDDWTIILSNPSYATAYAVRDTKIMELTDGTKIKMDLAAIDTDLKSDDSGTAKMTWICHGIPYSHRINATNTTEGGWAGSEMRSWLISDILSKIPTEIKSHIVSVKKSYRSKLPNDETLWSNDEIWIPSYREIGLTNTTYMESEGVVYSSLFASSNDRIKYNNKNADEWCLRSAYDATCYKYVNYYAGEGTKSAIGVTGVVFAFCTD